MNLERTGLLGLVLLAVGVDDVRAVTRVRVTANGASSSTPAIAYGADQKCRIVWSDQRDGNPEIYFAAVDAWGNRLTADVNISLTAGSSTVPKVGIDAQGNAYVCWLENSSVSLVKVDPQGNILNTGSVNLGFSYLAEYPDISVLSDGRFGVGFSAQHGGSDDYFMVNYNAGITEQCQVNVYTNMTWFDRHASIMCTGNLSCTLAWQRVGYLDGSALAQRTSNASCGLQSVRNACDGTSFGTMSNHGAGIVYQLSNRVYLSSGNSCGTQLSENPGPSTSPAAAVLDPTYSIAVWEDGRNGNSDIYFARYVSSTFVKSGADSNLTPDASASRFPAVATNDQGVAFVAWQDNRDGNTEIYFARTPEPDALYGTITGTVYDGVTLQPLAGASIHVVYPDRPILRTQNFVASSDGSYRLAGLAPGLYALSATLAGHASEQQSGIAVIAGGTETVDLYVSTGTVLQGVVRDQWNRMPIGRAQVRLTSSDGQFVREVTTGPDGRYRFDLLPGNFRLEAAVPAIGTPGDYYSVAHPYYTSEAVDPLAVGPTPQAYDFQLESNTVVLVHGLFGDHTTWGKVSPPPPGEPLLRARLETEGFHTEAVDYDWSKTLPGQGVELGRWFSTQVFRSARVVAHSMGGLTARWYLERTPIDGGTFRVPTLVTLGTPHHGSALASDLITLVEQLGALSLARAIVPGASLLSPVDFRSILRQRCPSILDLEPSSRNLDLLNYGSDEADDAPSRWLCVSGPAPHEPEDLVSTARYVTFAGEHPQGLRNRVASVFFTPCQSDGIVAVHSAMLHRAEPYVSNYRTSCLIPEPGEESECDVTHKPGREAGGGTGTGLPAVAGDFTVDLKNSRCVATGVVRALREEPLGYGCSNQVAVDASVAPAGGVVLAPGDSIFAWRDEIDHLLAPGAAVDDTLQATAGSTFGMSLRWHRGGVQIRMRAPSGAVHDSASAAAGGSATFVSEPASRWARLEVEGVEGGDWIVTTTVTAADSTQRVWLRPYESGGIELSAEVNPRSVRPAQSLVLSARPLSLGTPILGAQVVATVTAPTLAQYVVPLLDTGTGGDPTAGDGEYAARFIPGSLVGDYAVDVRANGGNVGAYASRQAQASFRIAPSVDIVLFSGDLLPDPLWAYPSDPIPLRGTVRNTGRGAADSVWVRGIEDSTGVAFLDTTVTIAAQSAVLVSGVFRSARVGSHRVSLIAVALGDVTEESYDNNRATRGLEVVAFGGVPVAVDPSPQRPPLVSSRTLVPRSVPSPARGVATIEFVLPLAARAWRLFVYDVAGRTIARRDGGALPAGVHRISWDPSTQERRRLPSGVYLYRIEAAGLVGHGRVVLVR